MCVRWRLNFILLFLSFGFWISPFRSFCQVTAQDSLALLSLYNSTDGANWVISWDTAANVSEWQGVSIQDNRVTGLSLPSNQLQGPLPSGLGDLVKLTVLDLSGNEINGIIPGAIGNLDSLIVLNLSSNQIQGSIPIQIQNLELLVTLTLSSNQLSGTLPVELTSINSLTVLDLSLNSIEGQIPPQVGQLTTLNELDLSDNLLSGAIPNEMGQLSSLTDLNLSSNQLDSIIPQALGGLPELRVLNLSNNNLAGVLPLAISQLNKLVTLNLSLNQLTGPLPKELSELSILRNLSLQGNNITGPIPEEFGQLDSLRILNLSSNQLTDSIPLAFQQLLKLTNFNIAQNEISNLPDLTDLLDLVSLNVRDNRLTFEDLEPNISIFKDTADYSPQAEVDVEGNVAIPIGGIGVLTTTIGGTKNLYRWIRDTVITDFLPDSSLVIVDFQEENSGIYTCEIINEIVPGLVLVRRPILVSQAVNIADSLALLRIFETTNGNGWLVPWDISLPVSQWAGVSLSHGRVVGVNLSNNQLEGYLPSEIELLSNLEDLRLSVNLLSDTIPSQVGNLVNLEILTLDNNLLTGIVPEKLFDSDSLKILYLNDNLFTKLPPISRALQELRVFNNFLTFSDLEINVSAAEDFIYAPQLERPIARDTIDQGSAKILEIPIDIGGTSNNYFWIRNNIDTLGTDSTFLIQDASFRDFGEYRIAVSNDILDSLVLEFRYFIEVSPNPPVVQDPVPYCIGDTLVFLQAEGDAQLTIWYEDLALTSPIDSGASISYGLRQDRDTIFATNISGNLESPSTEVIIILRPTITQQGDTLYGSSGGVRYQWFFRGLPIEGATQEFYHKQEDRDGFYQVTLFTQEGCSATSAAYGLVTALDDLREMQGPRIYPNPTSGILRLQNFPRSIKYLIYTPGGEVVRQGTIESPDPTLRLEGLVSGLYLLRLEEGETFRIVVD